MRRYTWLAVMLFFSATPVALAQSAQAVTRQQVMETADKNKDGRIGRVEFLERMKEAFYFIDTDKDGYVTIVEYQRSIQGADPARVATADRNKDGKISMDELLKIVSADFDEADKNDDGVIDEQEMRGWIAR